MTTSVKVLIVEDDIALAQMCAKLIQRQGHATLIAYSCQEALAIVDSNPDLAAVLTDVQMPHMSGIELLASLQELNSQLPVILMTGFANVVTSAEAVSLGAADYLSKPFDAETLIASLDRAFRFSPAASKVPEHV